MPRSPASRTRRPRASRTLGDLLNPMLVKEVRQALHQRFFLVSFVMALTVATAVTIVWSARADPGAALRGDTLFGVLMTCFALGASVQVPLSAWFSMDAEWQQGRIDHLRLSSLSGARTLVGKELAALVQVALYASAFGPFVMVSALMEGVEFGVVRGAFLEAGARSAALSAVAIALSCLGRDGTARGALVALVAFLCLADLSGVAYQALLLFDGASLQSLSAYPSIGNQLVGVSLYVAAAAVFIALANTKLEADLPVRSTQLRIAVSVATCAFGARAIWFQGPVGLVWIEPQLLLGALLILLPGALLSSEPDELPRHGGQRVPTNTAQAILLAPWLPGGTRGVLHMTMHILAALLFLAMGHDANSFLPSQFAFPIVLVGGTILYALVVVPSTFASYRARDARRLHLIRVAVVGVGLLSAVVLSIVSFVTGDRFSTGYYLETYGSLVLIVGFARSLLGLTQTVEEVRLEDERRGGLRRRWHKENAASVARNRALRSRWRNRVTGVTS